LLLTRSKGSLQLGEERKFKYQHNHWFYGSTLLTKHMKLTLATFPPVMQ